jgi:hypothetical protein
VAACFANGELAKTSCATKIFESRAVLRKAVAYVNGQKGFQSGVTYCSVGLSFAVDHVHFRQNSHQIEGT